MITGTFFVLLGLLVLEILRFPLEGDSITPDFVIGLLTSVPFLLLVGYGGRWLARSQIPEDRQGRIAVWMFGGLGVFVGINLIIMPFFPRNLYYEYVAWVRWAAALGAGVGVLIGIFEARAIDRELTAERRRIQNQQLEAENDRLDDFATILSHDLRNPLNVASGSIELASQTCDSHHLENAETALSRMDEIVEETLVLARSGKVIGETEPVALEMLAWNCWQNVDTTDATLVVDDPPTISADTDRVRHLLENLFRNSIHHAGREAEIRVGRYPGGFYVEDDGPGIQEADREAVFDAGFSTANDGNGFGLAIVRQIAEAHDWTTTVTESDAGGARFEFTGVEWVESRNGIGVESMG